VDGTHQVGVEGNLKRLGLEAMEVVNLRIVGSVHAPAEGSIARQVEALAELKQQGRLRHIGLSSTLRPKETMSGNNPTSFSDYRHTEHFISESIASYYRVPVIHAQRTGRPHGRGFASLGEAPSLRRHRVAVADAAVLREVEWMLRAAVLAQVGRGADQHRRLGQCGVLGCFARGENVQLRCTLTVPSARPISTAICLHKRLMRKMKAGSLPEL